MPSPFAPSLSSPFGGGNAAATTLGGEKKEAQTQNQSTFGGGLTGGGSFNDVKTTASGLKIPTPRTQIGGGGGDLAATGIAPAATAAPSFSPFLSGGGTKASAPPLPKTAPFGGGMQGSSVFGKTPPPKQQMKMTASAVDDFGDDLPKATSERHITGTCNEMCPTSELQRREDTERCQKPLSVDRTAEAEQEQVCSQANQEQEQLRQETPTDRWRRAEDPSREHVAQRSRRRGHNGHRDGLDQFMRVPAHGGRPY